MILTRVTFPLTAAALALALTGAAQASPCGDQIKAFQQQASQADAEVKPGQQAKPDNAQAPQGVDGGGTASASAKILEAQAHDQRGDEKQCMAAVDEAKRLSAR